MFVDAEYVKPAFAGVPVYFRMNPVAPAPAQFGPEYFGPPAVGPSPVPYGPYRPPPVYPALLNPAPPGPPPYAQPMMGTSFPHSQFIAPPPVNPAFNRPNFRMAASYPGEPVQIPENKPHECLVAHRKFMNWIHTVYYSSKSPEAFVQAWKRALKEMKQAFGPPHLPTVFVLNQFLAAVSANPDTIPWVESLHFERGSLPASILDEAYADFLEFEACRLGKQQPVPANPHTAAPDANQTESLSKQYCPYHQRYTKHPVEECFRNPQNTKHKRKSRRKQAKRAAALEAKKETQL
ncbi:hypothetical protein EN45_022220 [Penicillium chrysogenum]|uniref:Uncharacterized protein n=2 Tax=Penicillium chrysogenum species complex TaxID=254878 RepID=B6HBD1_PENRW|nr:hypothetical protein EN45_022220 [Penicillium chrysogenum]CAP94589.1 hypothetical protein PCH_Pc18g03650 [Penicillium rubens Wisconsin 54-1255]